MIKINNVSKKFITGSSSTEALFDIDLEIKDGEFTALMGPSGSGKSTLLNLIGGLDTPSEGQIFINNKNIGNFSDNQLSEYRNKHIGFVFQEFFLQPFLNVKENILLPTFFGIKQKNAEAYAEKLIKEVELTNKTHSLISELSGGQKQRTAIARALINKPTLILADEPTGNLDLKTGEIIIDLLITLHKTHNITMLIATHDPAIASKADRVVKIIDGKLTN